MDGASKMCSPAYFRPTAAGGQLLNRPDKVVAQEESLNPEVYAARRAAVKAMATLAARAPRARAGVVTRHRPGGFSRSAALFRCNSAPLPIGTTPWSPFRHPQRVQAPCPYSRSGLDLAGSCNR